jgi:hypothetical protein
MKKSKFVRGVLMVASAAALASCGGSGTTDESGSLTEFSVIPSEVTFTAPTGTAAGVCLGGGTAQIFVYGGTAPYRIDNTAPGYLALDKATVQSKGGSFTITTQGPCVDPGQVNVVDHLDRVISVKVSNKPAS